MFNWFMFLLQKAQYPYRLHLIALFILISLLTLALNRHLTPTATSPDATQNLRIAYNLAYHGVYSIDSDPDETLEPTNYREPLPLYLLAAHIRLHPDLASGWAAQSIQQGAGFQTLKQHNLLWAFGCLWGVALLIMMVVKARWQALIAAVLGVLLTYRIFLFDAVDLLLTEIQTGSLLLWSSVALIKALHTAHRRWWVGVGLLLGGLSLTKAAFFYVGVAFVIVLLARYLLQSDWTRRQVMGRMGLMGLTLLVSVSPWLVRNYYVFGRPELTQRGGAVLLARAYKNEMDILGGFYYYAPPGVKIRLGRLLGFSEADAELGGRLQRLNRQGDSSFAQSDLAAQNEGRPQDAVSYYRQARAEEVRLRKFYTAQGAENPALLADAAMQRQALRLIRQKPLRHLLMSALFLWRGMWCMKISTTSIPIEMTALAINGLAFIALWGMAIIGLWKRRPEMLGIALLPVGAIGFYALATHYIPRYSDSLIPNLVVAFVVTGAWGIEWCRSRLWQK